MATQTFSLTLSSKICTICVRCSSLTTPSIQPQALAKWSLRSHARLPPTQLQALGSAASTRRTSHTKENSREVLPIWKIITATPPMAADLSDFRLSTCWPRTFGSAFLMALCKKYMKSHGRVEFLDTVINRRLFYWIWNFCMNKLMLLFGRNEFK